jgi:hypothetical protein
MRHTRAKCTHGHHKKGREIGRRLTYQSRKTVELSQPSHERVHSLPSSCAESTGVHLAHVAHADDANALAGLHVDCCAVRYCAQVKWRRSAHGERWRMKKWLATAKEKLSRRLGALNTALSSAARKRNGKIHPPKVRLRDRRQHHEPVSPVKNPYTANMPPKKKVERGAQENIQLGPQVREVSGTQTSTTAHQERILTADRASSSSALPASSLPSTTPSSTSPICPAAKLSPVSPVYVEAAMAHATCANCTKGHEGQGRP